MFFALRMRVGMFAVIALVANLSAQEYVPSPEPDFTQQYTTSGPASRFTVGASLLFLKPGAGNLEYGVLVHPLPPESPHWDTQAINPNYAPAFDVAVRYELDDVGLDFRANWTHLQTNDEHSFVANPGEFAGPPYEIGPDAGAYNLGRGTARHAYDAINLDAGFIFGNGGPAQVRLFSGVQFANIEQTLSGQFRSFNGDYSTEYTNQSTFFGVGPRAGMLAELVGERLDVLGQLSVATLIGTRTSRMDFASDSPDLSNAIVPPNRQSLASPSAMEVIPALETKLGGGYTFGGRANGGFRIESGYQASVYFNAVNQYSISNVNLPSNVQSLGLFLRTAERSQSDFIAHGPYVSGTWTF